MQRLTTAVAVILLSAVIAQASRVALEDDFSSPDFIGRGLLQRTLDCTKVHSACSTCRNQRVAGSRTSELVCSACNAGWRLRRDGISKTCDCAPGFYKSGESCVACVAPKFCLGGDASNPTSAASDCASGLATTISGAKSLQQCFTVAGYGRTTSRDANGFTQVSGTACAVGTYNVGGNTAGCQKCPSGLTTANTQSASLDDCVAPAGSFKDKGIGKLCPKGSYTTALNSEPACTPCATGKTTETEGSNAASNCNRPIRGYFIDSADSTAKVCAVNTYNDGSLTAATTGCTACPNSWKTKAVGADGEALCLAPPGYQLVSGASAISECPENYYKADWNRNPCVECGTGLKTGGTGSVSKDACLVPAGSGITSLSPLTAVVCVSNTYGTNADRPATAAARCISCPANMYTADKWGTAAPAAGYQSETACQVAPGWGLSASGIAEKCQKGFYNVGKNRQPCQACAAGYTTLAEESDEANDCVIQPGWFYDGSKAAPCNVGTWSAGGDATTRQPTSCTACGTGTTTQSDESTSAGDCSVCQAGYGGSGCAQCDYNKFSFGGQAAGTACTSCAAGTVSRRRSTEAAMCYSNIQDTVRDVFMATGVGATWTADAAGTTSVTCASACTGSSTCITYRFKASSPVSCELLAETAGEAQELYFKLNNGADYVKYTVPSTVVFGAPVNPAVPTESGVSTAAACMASCTAAGGCEVASFSGSTCQLRTSELHEEYTGMWAVRGAKLVSDAGL